MLREGCPEAIKNCSGHFSKFLDPQVRNTLLTDISRFLALEDDNEPTPDLKGKMTAIPEGPYKALQIHFQGASSTPREAKVLSSYSLNGLTFSTFARHRGNSFVLIRRPSFPSLPAQIESMLQISANEIYFVVRYFLKPVSDDPFDKYPVLQSSLWSQDLGQLVVVKPQDIESHFACLAFEWRGTDSLAIVSLSRVFSSSPCHKFILTFPTGILTQFFVSHRFLDLASDFCDLMLNKLLADLNTSLKKNVTGT
jgi:hypothetical protein